MHVNKHYLIALIFLFLIVFLLTACDFGPGKEKRDKVQNEAQKRNASEVANETQRTGMGTCGDDKQCAKGGKNCKNRAIATEPSDCDIPPSLKCICPEFKVCTSLGSLFGWVCVSG